MIRLIFASRNPNKVGEIKAILGPGFRIGGLEELGLREDIPEPFHSLEENALAKARFVHTRFGVNCFADDTGLEVNALGGKPGVQSARYAGPAKDDHANIRKLLSELSGITDRSAQFRTVIALILDKKEYLFGGVVRGNITTLPVGQQGFGYDPVFIPQGYTSTFAEMEATEKNRISHRQAAIRKLANFLQDISGSG